MRSPVRCWWAIQSSWHHSETDKKLYGPDLKACSIMKSGITFCLLSTFEGSTTYYSWVDFVTCVFHMSKIYPSACRWSVNTVGTWIQASSRSRRDYPPQSTAVIIISPVNEFFIVSEKDQINLTSLEPVDIIQACIWPIYKDVLFVFSRKHDSKPQRFKLFTWLQCKSIYIYYYYFLHLPMCSFSFCHVDFYRQ